MRNQLGDEQRAFGAAPVHSDKRRDGRSVRRVRRRTLPAPEGPVRQRHRPRALASELVKPPQGLGDAGAAAEEKARRLLRRERAQTDIARSAQLRRRPNCAANVLVSQASSRSSNSRKPPGVSCCRHADHFPAVVHDLDVARVQLAVDKPGKPRTSVARMGSAMFRSRLVSPSGMAPFTTSHRHGRPSPRRPLRCVTGIDDFERRAGRRRHRPADPRSVA